MSSVKKYNSIGQRDVGRASGKNGGIRSWMLDDDLTDAQKERFNQVLNKTKGKGNNRVCFELSLAGVNMSVIETVAEALSYTDYYKYSNSEVRLPNPRQEKKPRGQKDVVSGYRMVPLKDALYGRFIKKIYGDDIFEDDFKNYPWGHPLKTFPNAAPDAERTIQNRRMGEAFAGFLKFKEYDSDRREFILNNPVTKKMVARRVYKQTIPNGCELRRLDGYDNVQFLTEQAKYYYDELYQLANVENFPELTEDNLENGEVYRTITEVAYENNLVKTPEILSLLDVMLISTEKMGIVVYMQPTRSPDQRAIRRGLMRLVKKINSVYRSYGQLIKKGIPVVDARETSVLQLRNWIEIEQIVSPNWSVATRADWIAPELETKTTKKKKTTSRKAKMATMEDLKAILGGGDDENAG